MTNWLLPCPDGYVGYPQSDSSVIVSVNNGKVELLLEERAKPIELTLAEATELAGRILETARVVVPGAKFRVLACRPWQRFVLGAAFDVGITICDGRIELYPADSDGQHVWLQRSTARELALEVLRQQLGEWRPMAPAALLRKQLRDALALLENELSSVHE